MAVLEGKPADRLPMYCPTIACDVSSAILGRPVHTGYHSLSFAECRAWVNGEAAHAEFEQKLFEDLIAIHRELKWDVIRLPLRNLGGRRPSRQLDEYTFVFEHPGGTHEVWQWDPKALWLVEIENTKPPVTVADWPARARRLQADLPQRLALIREKNAADEIAFRNMAAGQFAYAARGGGIAVGVDEASLMASLLEPGAVADILDCQLELSLAALDVLAANGFRIAAGGGDMADKNGPMYSPEIFRELMLPRVKKLAAHCRKLNLHYIWRTDGNLWKVTDMLFKEAGFADYGEVDRDAGMEVGKLHARYPDLNIFGNVSSDVLLRQSAGQVRDYCARVLAESAGRRYVHGPGNAILPGTSAENVRAMSEVLLQS